MILRKLKEKKGNIVYLSVLCIMGILFPVIGFITDIGKAKIIKQDLKHISQLSVLSCLARQQNTFDVGSCTANINTVVNESQKTRDYQIEFEGQPQFIGSTDMTVRVKLKATYKPMILKNFDIATIEIHEEAEASPKIINN